MKKVIHVLLFVFLIVPSTFSQNFVVDSLLREVELSLSQGDYNTAVLRLNQKYYDKSIKYNLLKAVAYENIGRYDSATISYNRILNIDTLQVYAYKGLARSYSSLGKINLAKQNFRIALKKDSTCVATRMQYASLLRREGNLNEALDQYRWLVQLDSTNFYFWELLGDCALAANKQGESMVAYGKAHMLDINNMPLTVKYLRFLQRVGIPPFVVQNVANNAYSIDSTYTPLLQTIGKIYIDLKEYDNAERVFTKAMELGDSSTYTLKYLGISKYSNGLYVQSEPYLEKAFTKDSSDSFLNFVYASALFQVGDRPKAMEIVDLTTKMLLPDSMLISVLYDLRGDIYFASTKYDLALENYKLGLQYVPNFGNFIFKMGKCYFNLKDYKVAQTYFNDYIKITENEKADENVKKKKIESAKIYLENINKELFFQDDK